MCAEASRAGALQVACTPLWLGQHTGVPDPVAGQVLGQIGYGMLPPAAETVPTLFVTAPVLGGSPGWVQRLIVPGPLQPGRSGPVVWRHDDTLLFGCLQLPERGVPGRTPLDATTEQAYRAVFATLAETGFPHLLRTWNYMADINRVRDGLERYRQFNIGRLHALRAAGRAAAGQMPAACALGTAAGPLTVGFLASRVAPLPVENPRQLSAYRYPPEYGPVSPSFSRAALLPLGPRHPFFISGTASIVGHASRHPGDILAQLRESVANLCTVHDAAEARAPGRVPPLTTLACTVYLRHPADTARVRTVLAEMLPTRIPPVFVQADVCRSELLVEIEASAASGVFGA